MKRSVVVPKIRLERSQLQSLRQQIYAQIAEAIRSGALPDGACLPSSRRLAQLLDVSRNTITEAYEKLLESDLIAARAGSGVRVRSAIEHAIPDFSSLRSTARAAHYPAETIAFEDLDGTALYLNAAR